MSWTDISKSPDFEYRFDRKDPKGFAAAPVRKVRKSGKATFELYHEKLQTPFTCHHYRNFKFLDLYVG